MKCFYNLARGQVIMVHSSARGHAIEFVGEEWRYVDTGERYVDTGESIPLPQSARRRCSLCGEDPTPEGHDACFGTLENVKYACCGHGRLGGAYVQFWGGACIRGQEALDFAEGQR